MGIRRLTTPFSAILCAVALTATACGGAGASAQTAPPPPVLPGSAVPYLPSHVGALTAADLLKDGIQPGLAGDLSRWDFQAGAQRTFHGRSHKLQLVVARTLDFGGTAGARAYVAYVKQHAGGILGADPVVSPLASGARTGWLFMPAGCACHMAQPAVIAIVSGGRRVSYLEVNGPDATAKALKALLEQAP
jgi:hypothetical protein